MDPSLKLLLLVALLVYLVAMYAISYFAQRRIDDAEQFLVAGRRLPLSLSWMTLLATWFGAGTLLTVADEVRHTGLSAAALDPLGAGCCLLLVGLFVAGPIWRMQLLTVPDLFRRRFGPRAELISSLILVPSYFGWIAAQFTALAGILELFFGVPIWAGLVMVAVVGTGYTFMGGMWSVTLTDAVQISLVLAGLVVLAFVVLGRLGDGSAWAGLERIGSETNPQMLTLIPLSDRAALAEWIGLFVVGALGNVPGQDLMQRVFAAKSDAVARRACLVAGWAYLAFGSLPLLLALAGNLLLPESLDASLLSALAGVLLHPVLAVIFLLVLVSAVLSTIDSAILSPASVLAQNVFSGQGDGGLLRRTRTAVLIVSACSLAVAMLGDDAYSLLEEAYALTLVGLFVPLMLGLYSRPQRAHAASASMIAGTAVWGVHFVAGWEVFAAPVEVIAEWQLPVALCATAVSLLVYLIFEPPWRIAWSRA